MPLGQQEQAFIDQLVAAGGRGFNEMEVAEGRGVPCTARTAVPRLQRITVSLRSTNFPLQLRIVTKRPNGRCSMSLLLAATRNEWRWAAIVPEVI